jgi:hypothetical protein
MLALLTPINVIADNQSPITTAPDLDNSDSAQALLSVDFITSYHSNRTLLACIAAPNCETYETYDGTRIRFKPGHEPGSTHFQSRFANKSQSSSPIVDVAPVMSGLLGFDGYMHTNVDMGDQRVNYGWKNPTDVVHELWGKCGMSFCDSHDVQVDTQIVVNACCGNELPKGYTLTLTPEGTYDGWDMRDNFVHAIVAAAEEGQVWTKRRWHLRTRDGLDDGELWEVKQTNFIAVSRFSEDGALHGFMSMKIQGPYSGAGWCLASTGVLKAVAGAINPIAGGIFGIVQAFCSANG